MLTRRKKIDRSTLDDIITLRVYCGICVDDITIEYHCIDNKYTNIRYYEL